MFQILIYSYVKISTPASPWKKSPPSKSWCLAKHPPFLKIWLEAQPPPAETGRGGGAHYAMGIDPAPFWANLLSIFLSMSYF